jgi:hypothetical protein
MPSKRTLIGAAAFSVALAGGGIAGAVLGTPSLSSAQDTPSATPAPEDGAGTGAGTAAPDGVRPRPVHPRLEVLRQAADALGMTPAELRDELKAGRSIAEVAEEKGVDKQDVVDAIVADATEKLEAEIQRLPDQVSKAVEHEGLPERGPRGPRMGPPPADAPRPDDAPQPDADAS